jgi:hypothetical protein
MTEDNIYTIALKYGVDNLNNGITYNKLLAHLKSKNIMLDTDLQQYFHLWFCENFFVDNSVYWRVKDFVFQNAEQSETFFSQFDNSKALIMGHAHQTFQDYQELKVAYESSKDASKFAIIAICVTASLD